MSKWLDVLKTIGPMVVAATVPGGAVLAPIIVHAIAEAEALPGASGQEKKAHALELVKAGAEGVNAAAQKQVLDPQLVHDTAENGIEAVVGAVNIVHSVKQKPAA